MTASESERAASAWRMLHKWGSVIGQDEGNWGGIYFCLDGKVWYARSGNAMPAILGDYFEFMDQVRRGAVPGFQHIARK